MSSISVISPTLHIGVAIDFTPTTDSLRVSRVKYITSINFLRTDIDGILLQPFY